jgi:hypothetical protein
MKEKYNMDESSEERIYKRDMFLMFHFNKDNPAKNKQDLLNFIEVASIKAEDTYVDWAIYPAHEDPCSCEERSTSYQLYAEGIRLETDEEYRLRLSWRIRQLKQVREHWEKKKKYFDSDGDSAKIQRYEDIIKTLN